MSGTRKAKAPAIATTRPRTAAAAIRPAFPEGSICSTCRDGNTCAHRAASPRAIQYCENFEVEAAAPAAPVIAAAPAAPATLLGLCSTCEHRDGCVFANVEGGVWACEQFE